MASTPIDHDGLFKQLLETFFWEFLELFLPETLEYLEPGVCTFLQQEFFTDVMDGEHKLVDLLAAVKFRGQDSYFLIHIEHQSSPQQIIGRRLFYYFAHLSQKHDRPVYPIVIFSFDRPLRAEPDRYIVEFPDGPVLEFRYRVIQLNRLDWRSFLQHQNPIAAALMAKMKMVPKDRPKVKAECLRLLATLKLDPARTHLISGFVDTYLRLNPQENQVFQTEIDKMGLEKKETVMQIVTSWMEEGIKQGVEKGEKQGLEKGLERETERSLRFVMKTLQSRFTLVPKTVQRRLQKLDADQLEALMELALTATTIAEFATQLPKTKTKTTVGRKGKAINQVTTEHQAI